MRNQRGLIEIGTLQLSADVARLPVGHLQLSSKAHRQVREFKTIGILQSVISATLPEKIPLTNAARIEVNAAFRALAKAHLAATGDVDWLKYLELRRHRPQRPQLGRIYFSSRSFDQLTRTARREPLSKAHLGTRALNALNSAKIYTIGNLISDARHGITPLRSAGVITSRELLDCFTALSLSVRSDGLIDWMAYAEIRGYAVLPAQLEARWSRRAFEDLGRTIGTAVKLTYGNAGSFLLANRLYVATAECRTLEQIGNHLGISKERARAIEESLLSMLRGIFVNDDYSGCRFRFRPEIVRPVRKLLTELKHRGTLINQTIWAQILAQHFHVKWTEPGPVGQLLVNLAGLRPLHFRNSPFRPIMPSRKHKSLFRRAVTEIEQILTWDKPNGLTTKEIHRQLLRKLKAKAPVLEQVPVLVASLPFVEKRDGRFRAQASGLKRRTDIYERILAEEGGPMHFKKIIEEAVQLVPLRHRGLLRSRALLSSDPRFVALGRTGLWALSRWRGVETRSIVNCAEHALKRA